MNVLTYNSSARGAGQFVRSLKIARVITGSFRSARCMILAGNSVIERRVPDHTAIVPLPQIRKSFEGDYLPAPGDSCVPVAGSLTAAFALRSRVIASTLAEFDPDVFLVDSRPDGLNGELQDVLRQLRRDSKCRTVLMLRDIVDDPDLVTRRWREQDTYRAIHELYDDIVIWGDEQTFDAVAAYKLAALQNKVTYLGYLGGEACFRRDDARPSDGTTGRVLVTVGGGFDGREIIDTVCDYARRNRALDFTIVLGAHSPVVMADLYRSPHSNVEVFRHVPELDELLSGADIAISMCGYNTLLELIERRKKIVAVPRSHSGAEQMMRARILSALYDGMWVVPQNELTLASLDRALHEALRSAGPSSRIDFRGAENLLTFLRGEVRVA